MKQGKVKDKLYISRSHKSPHRIPRDKKTKKGNRNQEKIRLGGEKEVRGDVLWTRVH